MHTYISAFLAFDMSVPFNPAFMNTGPSHRIKLKVAAKAMPLKASDAINGSPSPWKVLMMMPTHASTSVRRLQVSVLLRVALISNRRRSYAFLLRVTKKKKEKNSPRDSDHKNAKDMIVESCHFSRSRMVSLFGWIRRSLFCRFSPPSGFDLYQSE